MRWPFAETTSYATPSAFTDHFRTTTLSSPSTDSPTLFAQRPTLLRTRRITLLSRTRSCQLPCSNTSSRNWWSSPGMRAETVSDLDDQSSRLIPSTLPDTLICSLSFAFLPS